MASPWSFTPPANPFGAYNIPQSLRQSEGGGPDSGGEPCEPGYKKRPTQDGWECVPDNSGGGGGAGQCPGGQVWNSNTGRCEDNQSEHNCPEGSTWDSVARACLPKCPEGKARDGSGNCVDVGGGASGGSGGGGGSTTGAYKPPNYTPTKSPYDDALSKQLFETLTNMINGGDAPFGPDTIAKLQAAALQSNKGQLANSRTELQRRLINSGLSRSGAAPASFQKLESAASADLSNNFRAVAVNAVQQNYNARVTALNQAQQFLQSERANALSQDQLILAYARLKQEWATTQAGYAQQWKIVQNGNEQELMRLMLCLRTPGCTI